MGDLNTCFARPRSPREVEITTALADMAMEDMAEHFIQRRPYRSKFTWKGVIGSGSIYSTCDYILSNDRRCFKTLRIVDPRHFSSDHFAVVGEVAIGSLWGHSKYKRTFNSFPVKITHPTGADKLDTQFNKVVEFRKKESLKEENRRRSWISTGTLRTMDAIATLRRTSITPQTHLRRLRAELKRRLGRDKKTRIEEAGVEIENLFRENRPLEAWARLKRWYRDSGDRP